MSDIQDQRDAYEEFPDLAGHDLQNDLAEIIVRNLELKGWTFADLARAMRKKPPYITRVVSGSNCTLETAGTFIVALGRAGKVRLVDLEMYERDRKDAIARSFKTQSPVLKLVKEEDHGKKAWKSGVINPIGFRAEQGQVSVGREIRPKRASHA